MNIDPTTHRTMSERSDHRATSHSPHYKEVINSILIVWISKLWSILLSAFTDELLKFVCTCISVIFLYILFFFIHITFIMKDQVLEMINWGF